MFKLFTLILSASLITIGIFNSDKTLLLAGSCLYLLAIAADFVFMIKLARKFAIDRIEGNEKKRNIIVSQVTRVLEGIIVLFGLIATVTKKEEVLAAGLIIWVGSILIYFFCGVVIREIAHIPLEFGFGGWTVRIKMKKAK